jgi:hypothetical protein
MKSYSLEIPYEGNPGKACALSCCTMIARYFFKEETFEHVARVSRWKKDYVVWEFPFWNWILSEGIAITNYDLIDYDAWAKEGIEGLRNSTPKQEFEFYNEHTFDITTYSKDLEDLIHNKNFAHIKKKPLWEDLLKHLENGDVCTVVLNSKTLDRKEGFILHQVVITGLTHAHLTFHDPRSGDKGIHNRTETHEHFKKAWLESMGAPSLTAYRKL